MSDTSTNSGELPVLLIVEDDEGLQRQLKWAYEGYRVVSATDRAQAIEKIRDLTCLSDILPTGYHGAVTAGVGPGSTVYIAGAGPVGLAAAASARLLGDSQDPATGHGEWNEARVDGLRVALRDASVLLVVLEPRHRLRVLGARQIELRDRRLVPRFGVVERLLGQELAREQIPRPFRIGCR